MDYSPKENIKGKNKNPKEIIADPKQNTHLGSSNAFEETENPLSKDNDDITDEKLDELLED